MQQDLPQYRGSIYLDGCTYQLSLRIHEGQRHTSGQVPHSHPQYELHAVFCGEAVLEQEGFPPVVLQPGDCCVIPPHTYHLRRLKFEETRCCTLYIDSPKGAPFQVAGQSCIRLACAPLLTGYLNALEAELGVRQIGSEGSIQSLLTLLLVAMMRELSNLPQKCLPREPLPVFQQREEFIDNYFASHYWQDVSASDLAAHLGITTRHLARVMQKRYGCTFRQHLLKIRLYHARQQLTNSELPIWQIANRCGFTCQSAFATAFRKQSGCTPSQFRERKDLKN